MPYNSVTNTWPTPSNKIEPVLDKTRRLNVWRRSGYLDLIAQTIGIDIFNNFTPNEFVTDLVNLLQCYYDFHLDDDFRNSHIWLSYYLQNDPQTVQNRFHDVMGNWWEAVFLYSTIYFFILGFGSSDLFLVHLNKLNELYDLGWTEQEFVTESSVNTFEDMNQTDETLKKKWELCKAAADYIYTRRNTSAFQWYQPGN